MESSAEIRAPLEAVREECRRKKYEQTQVALKRVGEEICTINNNRVVEVEMPPLVREDASTVFVFGNLEIRPRIVMWIIS